MNIEKSLEVLRGMKFMQRKEEAQRRERLQQQAANPPASATAHNAAASLGGPSSSSAAPRARILFSSSSSAAGAAPQQGRLAFGVKRTIAVAPAVSVQHEDSGEAMGDGSSSTLMEGARPFQGGAPSSDQQDPSSSGGRFLLQTTVRAPKLPQALIRSEQDRRKRKRNEQEEEEFQRWEGQRRR